MEPGDIYVDLEPVDQNGVKGPGEDQAELTTFLGKHNRIRLGAPRVSDYLTELNVAGTAIPGDLAKLSAAGYLILRVCPTLTLLPDRGCVFRDIDFSIELIGTAAAGKQISERPLAYEVRPAEISEKIPYTHSTKTKQEVSGEAGGSAGKLIAKIARENEIENKGVYSLRRMYSYGANFYEAGWRIQASGTEALAGDITGLEVIVQVPPYATLSGRFRISAEIAVETAPDRWLTRSFGPRPGNPALEAIYSLNP
jgi:hypothetical protein